MTNIFYEHAGDGVTYNAGDTIIKHAEAGSKVNLITSQKGLAITADTINSTLNALAGKLIYSNYVTGERNLEGSVKIAGGLTSDSVIMATGNILFSEETGKGNGADQIAIPNPPEKQEGTIFNSTLTGDSASDLEYVLGGVVKDGMYKFTEDSSIHVSGEGAIGAKLVKDTVIDASGKTLTINVTDASKTNGGLFQNDKINSTVTADKLVINLDSKSSGQGAHAIHQNDGTMTINGDVDIDVKGDYSTVGVYSHAGSTTINGDVKVKLDGNHGGFGEYGAAGIYAHAGYGGATGGTINVNGNVDISGVGNGLFVNIGGATINANGGKINIVDDSKSTGYSAIYATCGKINMNVTKDESGKATGAGTNDVDITGNVVASVGAVNYVDSGLETEVNLGLTTGKSQLTGVVYNEFPEGGKTVSQRGDSKTFTGAVNLWLQNGATWTNEQQGTLPSVWGGEEFNGSKVTKFTGGSSAETAGNIYQKDSHDLTLDNYSGVTNVFYEHAGDGVTYNAGDTIIKHAEAGSVVNMVTSRKGVTDIGAALNALAQKLTYLNYATVNGSERNLIGYVKLAGGLTSDSVVTVAGNILFSEETGKGSSVDKVEFAEEPEHQIAKSYNSTLTGDRLKDYEYVMGGVVKDGIYKFTEDSSINVGEEGAIGAALSTATTINASGQKLDINLNDATGYSYGISQESDEDSMITADTLKIKFNGSDSDDTSNEKITAHGIHQTKGNLTINGNVNIDMNDDGFAETSGLYSQAGSMDLNGNVAISGVGNSYSAIYAESGKINVNVVKEETGKVIGSGNHDVTIAGNIIAVHKPDMESEINLGLATGNSKLTGIIYNAFEETPVTYSRMAATNTMVTSNANGTGGVNLWLMNGATWTNEQQGNLPANLNDSFSGSYVNNLVGGSNYNHAGIIHQKDGHDLNVDQYSGSTLVWYDHENSGDDVADYKAGNTVIKNASEGAYIRLSTGSEGIHTDDKVSVEKTLAALAQKLIYSANDTNLSAQVQIAGGLTTDRIGMWLGDLSFDENHVGHYSADSAHRIPVLTESEFVKGPRTATMNSMLSWRDMAGDTYHHRRAALDGDEGGVWAKTYGGKNKYNGNNTSFRTNYWAGQVGYDKVLSNGWITGVAFDYRSGDDTYLTGDGKNKAYVLGFYGSKDLGEAGYLDINAKVGHVKNEFTTRNESGSMKSDYSTTGYSLSAMYGKHFGSDKGYLEPQVELTWSRLGSADFSGTVKSLGTLHVTQDAFNSLVGRIGLEAGQNSTHGYYFARLSLAHEFAGDVNTHYLDSDGGTKDPSYDLGGTWTELTVGGTYSISKYTNFYGDFTKGLSGDYKRDWKVNAGVRFRF